MVASWSLRVTLARSHAGRVGARAAYATASGSRSSSCTAAASAATASSAGPSDDEELSSEPRWITQSPASSAPITATMTKRIIDRQHRISSVPMRSSNTLHVRDVEQMPFTDFELVFLGTSAGSPSVRRNPTAVCLRLAQQNWMFDCAEGSLRQLMKSVIRVPLTNKFFITHLHGDHLYGLPGILCTLDNHNADFMDSRTKKHVPRPIAVYGPLGLYSYLNTVFATSSTRITNLSITVHELVTPDMLKNASAHEKYMRRAPTHPSLKREMIQAEWDGQGHIWKVFDDGKVKVVASTLKHTITSFGYVIEEHTIPGRLKADELLARGLPPGPLYKELKRGASVALPNGELLHASEVTGPPARGRKVAILGDTADTSRMFDIGQNCDANGFLYSMTGPGPRSDAEPRDGRAGRAPRPLECAHGGLCGEEDERDAAGADALQPPVPPLEPDPRLAHDAPPGARGAKHVRPARGGTRVRLSPYPDPTTASRIT